MVTVAFATVAETVGVYVMNKRAVKLAGAGVFLRSVSLQIGEMIFELRRANTRHSFDRGLNDYAAMKTALNGSARTRSTAARPSASARREGV